MIWWYNLVSVGPPVPIGGMKSFCYPASRAGGGGVGLCVVGMGVTRYVQ